MKRQKGFTLIELIIVIIVLGILAAYAIPRYFSLEKDARVAVVKGLAGSIKAATEIVHGKGLIDASSAISAGQSLPQNVAAADGTSVDIAHAGDYRYYPEATAGGIANALSNIDGDFTNSVDGDNIIFVPKGVADSTKCQVVYTYKTDGSLAPTVAVTVDDCG